MIQGLERGLGPTFLTSPRVTVIQLIHRPHLDLKSQKHWVPIPTLALGSCVNLSKLMNLSEPQCHLLLNEII